MIWYRISIWAMSIGVKISALFHEKNKTLLEGHKEAIKIIRDQKSPFSDNDFIAWFHCASLGEFEQGRPIINRIKKEFPEVKILLSFFSPSGYEVRKDYELADHVTYLPFDTLKNAEDFISCYKPNIALFIKYEFWYNYIKTCKENNIPLYSVSTIFRSNQVFFKRNTAYQKVLDYIEYFFVQNKQSNHLLESIGYTNHMISGDTRFDRVMNIRNQTHDIELIKKFCRKPLTLVIGSLWEEDLEILKPYIIEEQDINIIIAPHETDKKTIRNIIKRLHNKPILHSELTSGNFDNSNVLLIDCIGKLTSIYSIADIAYVGGAFGSGLHNILEPSTFGTPVIFGPNYSKFQEAKDLIEIEGAFSITTTQDLKTLLNTFVNDKEARDHAGVICYNYITENAGATDIVYEKIKPLFYHAR